MVGQACGHDGAALAVAAPEARHPKAQRLVGASQMVEAAPPLNMQQQAVLGFGERPGSAAERCHPLAQGQVHPLHEGRLDGFDQALFT